MDDKRAKFRKQTSLAIDGSVLSFHDIHYSVTSRKGCWPRGEKIEKQILRGVSGLFKPGMNAIMGPTGCGKSSFLDVLAGRKDPAGLTGTLLVDGKKQPKNFRNQSGYVVQDDMIMGTLTVRENISMSANLRLPNSIPSKEKLRRVNEIIVELGLSNCAKSKVGTEFTRGVSGGERKRTSVAMELITQPSVLFLDEPTTGLDANTAHSVMTLLYRLSHTGHTIIFSIHQPRFSIYRLFDRLMLLGRGETLYHGHASEAVEYLAAAGYHCQAFNNPPDFFLDVVNGSVKREGEEESEPNIKPFGESSTDPGDALEVSDDKDISMKDRNAERGRKSLAADMDVSVEDENERIQAIIDRLVKVYKESQWCQKVEDQLASIWSNYDSSVPTEDGPEHASSIHTQIYHLSIRAAKDMIRNPQVSTITLGVAIFMAIAIGIIYWQVDNDIDTALQNRSGAYLFVTMIMIFVNMAAIELFINDRALFLHESLGGYYHTSAYFISKILCDMIPSRTVPAIVFTLITYFMIGFENNGWKFMIYFATLYCTCIATVFLHFAVAAGQTVFAIANLLTMMIHIFSMIFSGLLVNINDVVVWLRWVEYISIFRYSTTALAINGMKGIVLCNTTYEPEVCDITGEGEAYMKTQGIDYDTDWELGRNIFAIIAIGAICAVLAYLQLRFSKRYK